MNKKVEYEFCMNKFKPLIAALTLMLVIVLLWSGYHCTSGSRLHGFNQIAAAKPMGPPIKVRDKMLHPYWGNCNKCHITTNAGKPVSQVMAGPPVAVNDKMLHEYWGNCMLCHTVTGGFQPKKTAIAKRGQAQPAAFKRLTAQSIGVKLQTVTAAMMAKFGLANKDGVIVLSVVSGSKADIAGLKNGDEITVVGNKRIEDVTDFETEISKAKPGSKVRLKIYRGNRGRNLFVRMDKTSGQKAMKAVAAPTNQNRIERRADLAEQNRGAATAPRQDNRVDRQKMRAIAAPMTQNKIETLAEQFGVPKTEKAVTDALRRQKNQPVAGNYFGKVAVASSGPGFEYQVSPVFGNSPYFIVYDPATRLGKVIINPNANDLTGRDVQTGQYMVDLGVSNVIAGEFSQNAASTLHTLRVNAYSGLTGSVSDTLKAYSAGRLVPSSITKVAATVIQ